jgi:hypothetical protein
VAIDDPEVLDAAAAYHRHGQRSQAADIAATIVLLMVHAFLFGATIVLLSLLVMGTDPCGSVKCGDPAWIDRAMTLGIWAGGAVAITDLVVAVYRLVRGKVAFFIPIIGCVAQVALGIGAAVMESQAGPV